jgi:carbon-monoxide dehydrogenase small subunit
MLRSEYRLTSVKKGCEAGECGACTVLINGESFNACIYLAVWAEGKEIRTLEGVTGPQGELSAVQRAFVEEGAIQCGFCTPGFVLTAEEIAAHGQGYTDEELGKLLSGHLCRCTGYENILKAVKRVAGKKQP